MNLSLVGTKQKNNKRIIDTLPNQENIDTTKNEEKPAIVIQEKPKKLTASERRRFNREKYGVKQKVKDPSKQKSENKQTTEIKK